MQSAAASGNEGGRALFNSDLEMGSFSSSHELTQSQATLNPKPPFLTDEYLPNAQPPNSSTTEFKTW